MRKIVVLFAGLLFVAKLSGQQAYVAGYLVLNNHDTLHGLIQNTPNYVLTEKVTFRQSAQNHPVDYGPDAIISFKFSDDKYFESHVLNEVNNSVRKNLQCLVKGRVSLYILNEKKKSRFYITDSIHGFHELLETYKKVSGGKRSNFEYVFTLKEIMNDRIVLYPEIDKSKLKPYSLIDLVSKYNSTLTPAQNTVFRSKNKTQVTPVIYSGLSYRYTVVGNFGYTGGVTFNFFRPEKSDNISFNFGIHYTNNTFSDGRGDFDIIFPIDIVFKMGSKRASPGFYFGISPNIYSGKKKYTNDRYYGFYPFGFDLGINKAFYIKDKKKIFTDFRINSSFIGLSLGYGF